MALHLPPAVSISKFTGGYKVVSDYTDLADTETNNARNTVYGPNGDIEQRLGCEKLSNQRLFDSSVYSANTAAFSAGLSIVGHYFFDKIGTTSAYHVVAAGSAIFTYSTATANPIRVNLSANSTSFYTFAQIADPRNVADDMLVMANGVDPIQIWTGTGTAVALSTFTSASAVPVGPKYILNFKQRIYAGNIVDATDVDAAVKVTVSGFGTDGAADPHRFSTTVGGGSFYLGRGRQGVMTGMKVIHDQIVLYTRKSVWKFDPGNGDILDTSNRQEMQEAHGCLAPGSLVDVGNFHIYLSEQGVYAFDGVTFVHLSEKVDQDLFDNSNPSQLPYSRAVYYKKFNQYILYYPSQGSSRNDTALIYDLRLKVWQPPVTGRRVSYISTYDTSDFEEIIFGDYVGYLYQDHKNDNDGLATGYNGTATAGGGSTLTDSAQSFPTTNDGLSGLVVRIIAGLGSGQERVIASNTGTVLTTETPWTITPNTTSQYTVSGIDALWRSPDYAFGTRDLTKLFRHVRTRVREDGNFNLTMYYIVDFKTLSQATSKDISLRENGGTWDVSSWDADVWDGQSTIIRKISLRNTNSQRLQGTHLALQFYNGRANERFRLSGFDIELKPDLGKR